MKQEIKIESILFKEEEILKKVDALADEINKDYNGKELLVVGILKGSCIFMCDLIRRLKMDVKVSFMTVSSYGDGTSSSGNVNIKQDLDTDIKGKNVLIIEDIIDSGNTMSKLVPMLKERKPESVKVCALLSKPSRREADFEADYTGFEIEDRFIVGYGLDCGEQYRNLPYIGVIEE